MADRYYIADLRQQLGLEATDTSRDAEIERMAPMERLKLLCDWHFGDASWATYFLDLARDAGMKIEENPKP